MSPVTKWPIQLAILHQQRPIGAHLVIEDIDRPLVGERDRAWRARHRRAAAWPPGEDQTTEQPQSDSDSRIRFSR